MKKLFLAIIATFAINNSFAQNTFPTPSGSVGIGTTSPNAKLHIVEDSGTGSTAIKLTNRNSTQTWGLATDVDAVDDGNFMIYNADMSLPNFVIKPNGNIGIGTTTPSAKLDVNGNGNFNGTVVSTNDMISTNGTIKAFLSVSNSYATGVVGTQSNHDLAFYTNSLPVARFTTAGDFGIGTSTPDAKLAVNGTVHAREVKVDLTGWPDYVLKPSYNLASLQSVKSYIDINHHLPDMPSEQQVAKEGLNLGEIVKLQTKKIEELTMYLIEKDKKDQAQKQEINVMKQQVKTLLLASRKK